MNAKFEKLSYEQKTFSIETTVKVECKTDYQKDGFSVITVSPSVYQEKFSAQDGKIPFNGKLIVSVCGLNENGALTCLEYGSAFADVIQDERVDKNDTVLGTMEILQTESFNGNDASVSVTVKINADVYKKQMKEYFLEGDNVVTNPVLTPVTKSTGLKRSESDVYGEFEIGFPVDKVLIHTESADIASCHAEIGSVAVEGEIHASVYLLQKSENGDIVKKNETFPFRIEADCPDAMPAMSAKAFIYIKRAKYDIEVDEETGTSKAVLTVGLICFSEATVREDALIPTDAFSTKNVLSLTVDEFTVPSFTFYDSFEKKFNEKIPVLSDDESDAKILATFSNSITLVDKTISDGKLVCEAVIKATSIIKTDETVKAVNYEFPLEFSENFARSGSVNVKLYVTEINARFYSETEIECFGKVKVYVETLTEDKVKIIAKAEETDVLPQKTDAISVYIAFEGESLFQLAKRLRVPPETISAINPELEFPLKKDERIVVYRRLNRE